MLLSKESFPLRVSIDAVSKAKSTTVTSSYVFVGDCHKVVAHFNWGAMDSGTATVNFLQAVDTAGTSSKALTAGNFAQFTNAVNNAKTTKEELVAKMDGANGFDCIALQVVLDANVATAAVYAAQLHGIMPDYIA